MTVHSYNEISKRGKVKAYSTNATICKGEHKGGTNYVDISFSSSGNSSIITLTVSIMVGIVIGANL